MTSRILVSLLATIAIAGCVSTGQQNNDTPRDEASQSEDCLNAKQNFQFTRSLVADFYVIEIDHEDGTAAASVYSTYAPDIDTNKYNSILEGKYQLKIKSNEIKHLNDGSYLFIPKDTSKPFFHILTKESQNVRQFVRMAEFCR